LKELEQRYHLTDRPSGGVTCDENGLLVGEVPLLERVGGRTGGGPWRARSMVELNRDLGACFGLPIEFSDRLAGLDAVVRALDRDDLARAQIATLHLRIPDPPALTKAPPTRDEIMNLARRLQACGLLKAGWDAAQHPRWPAGSQGSVGGEFKPGDGAGEAASTPSRTVAQLPLTLPLPVDVPFPGVEEFPFPSEIVLPPLIGPDTSPRSEPRNPYPSRPECVAEWARAEKYCKKLVQEKKLGRGDYRGMGRFYYECVMGQVSEECGGNSLRA